ncbi:hypothetical protein RPD76_07690 [Methylomonas sp. MV1]|uniref:hypothetical protein n=1 Tax=Methylomonas sp. MV1 TaxID=3073620 RepID=UPI0028A35290|nr:hypothetical protein [Methylomonas sp. MV1]MDT4329788.1 hypothetical protein [Methylomonas sp. MV1]
MRLDIPLDLPGHSFIDQLQWLETWACLPKGALSNSADTLAAVANEGAVKMVPVLLDCMNCQAWSWPAYDAHIEADGFTYSDDPLTDMAEQIYQKYRANKMAIHRKSQMEPLKHLRPYWELCGRCASSTGDEDATLILDADDPFWTTHRVPWRCEQIDCRCYVNSLSEYERNNP